MSLNEIVNSEQGSFQVTGTDDEIKKFLVMLDEKETYGRYKYRIDNKTENLHINSRESRDYNPVIFAHKYIAYVKRGSALVKLTAKNQEAHKDTLINICYNVLKECECANKTKKYMN